MKTKKGIIVSYAQKTKGYQIWLINEKEIRQCFNCVAKSFLDFFFFFAHLHNRDEFDEDDEQL